MPEQREVSGPLDAVRRAFDERAPVYDEGSFHRDLAAFVASFAAESDVTTVLDAATGTALVLGALRPLVPDARLIGVDISSGMLAIAQESLPNAEFLQADVVALPLEDASVDLVTCVTALHVIPDAQSAIREWRRVLRPGGRVVTATFTAESRRPVRPEDQSFAIDHEPFASPSALTATMAVAGFAMVRQTVWRSGPHAVLIAELRQLPAG